MELIAKWYPGGIASKAKEDIARRDEQISELLSNVQDDPAKVYELLQLQDYGLVDQQDFYFELRSLLAEALDQVDNSGDFLLLLALSPDTNWYIRRQVVYLLTSRPDKAMLVELIPLLEESGLQGEIRAAVATRLGQAQVEEVRPILLSLYHALRRGEDPRLAGWTYAEADLLEALGYLGERETLRPLLALQYHNYQSRRLSGQRGLAQLIKHLGGLKAALNLLDNQPTEKVESHLAKLAVSDRHETVRRWAVEQLASTGGHTTASKVLCDRLSDPSWAVANAAVKKLITLPEPPVSNLRTIAQNLSLPPTTRLWAAYVLLKLNQKVEEEVLNSIPDYPVSLPDFIKPTLRRAIIQCWSESSEVGTDVRWLVEGQLLPTLPTYELPFEPLKAALEQRGLTTLGPLSANELYKQGRGTFYVLQSRSVHKDKLQFYTLYLTMLGPFAYLNVLTSDDDAANSAEIPFNTPTPEETRQLYREALEAVGLTLLESQVTTYVFPGLNIYYFGNREPLPINDLLYYWQD
ncbi:MAG: hypothetical protein WCS37_01450 [Chloroflexota bacterium]|nr:HEAT repeat domain-containing protein [Chloroflexota bacterium]